MSPPLVVKVGDHWTVRMLRKRRPPSEAEVQRAVIQHLRLHRRKGWSYWATPNAAKRSPRQGRDLKSQGMLPGVGDLSLLSPDGTYHELEIKTHKGHLSQAQRARAIEVEMCHGKWACARGLEQALAQLTEWGALR